MTDRSPGSSLRLLLVALACAAALIYLVNSRTRPATATYDVPAAAPAVRPAPGSPHPSEVYGGYGGYRGTGAPPAPGGADSLAR